MNDFFRFPHTPHIVWLGKHSPRDDKVLSAQEGSSLLAGKVQVEEKLDGANLGISISHDGHLRGQNRGQYLLQPYTGQFSRLGSWLAQHHYPLVELLGHNLILFGEWCAARHSLDYASLPDLFLVFDVYDRAEQKFWSVSRRNELAEKLGLAVVPTLMVGHCTVDELKQLLQTRTSHYRAGPMEGVVVRHDSADWCEARAKLVRADFTQAIEEHWRSRRIEWNRVADPSAEGES